jgi:hypothetical protein
MSENKEKEKMSSEHRGLLKVGDKDKEEPKKEEEKEEERVEVEDECEGRFPDSEYPKPPFLEVLEEQEPSDSPSSVDEVEYVDQWLCPACNNSPCQFLQYQEELERIVDCLYPEVTNKTKRYHMYRHMSRRLHGPLGKGVRRKLPVCFTQGLSELFPSADYVGFKPNPFSSGGRGDYDRDRDDGTTYDQYDSE